MSRRALIVNADDFGQSSGVNRGVIESFEHGIVTSASLMVRWAAAAEAAEYTRAHPDLGLGLHLDLGEWMYLHDEWRAVYEVVHLDDPAAVVAEVDAQVETFRLLTGRDPDHLDSHQHVHREGAAATAARAAADRLGVPLRDATDGVAYCGSFYGQTETGDPFPEAITVPALVAVINDLPPGTTELGCHPGYDDGLPTMYRRERVTEVRTLTDPAVRAAIAVAGVELTTFSDGASALARTRPRA